MEKQPIFLDDADRRVFLDCFARHLGSEPDFDSRGRPYRYLRDSVALGAYCLLSNHFHLLVQERGDGDGISRLMRSAMTAYGAHFNARYSRRTALCAGSFRSRRIVGEGQLCSAAVYVHLNYRNDPLCAFSSHGHLVRGVGPEWVASEALLSEIGRESYLTRLEDVRRRRQQLAEQMRTAAALDAEVLALIEERRESELTRLP
ncbi:MAG: hypothetical protein WAP35_01700 [Solirubrobacterales bacterium]